MNYLTLLYSLLYNGAQYTACKHCTSRGSQPERHSLKGYFFVFQREFGPQTSRVKTVLTF